MKGRKRERFKSILLVCLVFSSLLLSYLIITYKPDYELFTRRTQQKVQEGDKNNLVGFLIPDVMVKTYPGMREEAIVPNSITKISSVEAVKDKQTLKELLVELSKGESTEVRVRNRNIEDITTNNTSEKISIVYQEALDSALVKALFFSEENSNVSLEFDTIALLKDRPNMLYLYKKDDKNYLQVTLKEAVYDKINEKFNETKKDYAKYSLNNKFIYLKEADEEKVIDEYSAEEVNITRLAKDVFEKKDDVRVGADNEITDGYAILKSQNHRIVYTNPSNEGGKEVGTTVAINNTINFLELGYASDTNYQLTTSLDGITIFQETHKESIVFSKEGHADIVSEDNSNGIYRLTSPKRLTKTYLSSKEVGLFEVEKMEYVINYLYNNTNLKNVTDIVLGYEKAYNKENNSFSYTPAWYVKYNNRYISFKKIKELVDGGGKL
mgnify:FL=1